MIEIGSADERIGAEALEAPGGFLWWYLDLVAPGGDGIVLIWSYGLPFLPGYASACRRGSPQRPLDRPAVNVAVYRRGAPVFYLLQEAEAAAVEGEQTWEQRIGGCRFLRRVDDGRVRVDADLDLAVPGTGERLTGRVRVEGAARAPSSPSAPGAPHVWTPLTGPAEAEAALDFGGASLVHLRGRAYHDRNLGRVPLHALGIDRWTWGRAPLAGREAIWYLLHPEGEDGAPLALGLEVGEDGGTRTFPLEVEEGGWRRSWAGPRWPERLRLRADGRPWVDVRHRAPADVGPFYLRLPAEATTADGERALGWGETCHPARVDLPLHRPFVRMRVHRPGRRNSAWLPLFTGTVEGRAGRLLRHIVGSAG